MKRHLLIALALVAVLFLVGWTIQRQQWEYKLVFSPTEKKINEVASQGWELVTVDTNSNYVFKRVK